MNNKKQSPLFELINKQDGKGRRSIPLPSWMGGRSSAAQAPSAPQSAAAATVKSPPARPTNASASASAAETAGAPEASEAASNLRRWMKQPTVLRLPRAGLVALVSAAVVIVGVTFWLGKSLGRATAAQQLVEHAEAVGSLARAQEQPVNPALIPSSVEGVGDAVASPVGNRGSLTAQAGGDPRQAGLNYYRLTVVPASSREEADRAAAFLRENGVDTALIPINNGRSLKLVALRGFTRPLSDPEAERFEEHLKMLGRKWKAQQRGSSDWKDMIAEKYRPGVN